MVLGRGSTAVGGALGQGACLSPAARSQRVGGAFSSGHAIRSAPALTEPRHAPSPSARSLEHA